MRACLRTLGSVTLLCVLCAQAPRAMPAPAAQKPELLLQSAQTTVNQLAFSPDGRLLASGGMNDNSVHLWEVATGYQVRNLETSAGGDFGATGVTALAFSPAGRYVAAGYFDGSTAVWEVGTGRKVRDFDGPPGDTIDPISGLSFDRDEKLLIGTSNQTAHFWDIGSGSERTDASQALCYGGLSANGRELISLEIARPSAKEMQKAQKDLLNQMMKGQSGGGALPGSLGATDLILKDISSGRQTTKKTVTGVGLARSQGVCAVATTDGRVLIPSVTSNTVQIADGLSGGNPRVLTSTDPFSGGADFALTLSADGRTVALGVGTAVTIWDGSRSTPLYVKRIATGRGGEADAVKAAAFSPDGRLLAIASQASGVLICERATGRDIARFAGGANIPFSVGFAAMGRRLLAGERTRWDLDSGRAERVSAGPFSFATAISDDGQTVAIGHSDGPEVEIWDASQKRKVSTLAPSGTSRVQAVGLSHDGKLAAVTYFSPPKLATMTPATNNPMDLLTGLGIDPSQMMMGQRPPAKGKGKAGAAPAGPDLAAIQKLQERLVGQLTNAAAGSDGLGRQIKIFETATGKEVTTLTHPSSLFMAFPQNLEFSPDGKRVAVSYKTLPDPFVFDVATGAPVVLGPPPKSQPATPGVSQALLDAAADPRLGARLIGSISFSPDGRQMAVPVSNRSEGFAAAGRVQSGRRPRNRSSSGVGATGAGVVSGPIEIWDVASARKTSEVAGHPDGTDHAVFSADGKTLATSSFENHDISVWDVATGREIRKIGRLTSTINALALSPDGKLLAVGAFDGATRLYDTTKGEQIATLLSINDGSDWLVVTPDGLFDGSPAAWNKILWRFSQNTFDVAPVEVFFNEYYYPDLLADLVAGKRPKAKADLSQKDRRQAEVKLELPGVPASGDVSARDVTVKVHVTKAPAGARDVRLFRNGSLVKIWHGDAAATADFEAKVPIVAGANRFTAYVFNTDNVKSTDAVAEVTGADSLKRRGIGYVVAVGVNEYENPDYNLKFAVADADSFSADVKTQLEKQNRFERVEVTRLVDRSATKANILKTIGDLAKKVQPEDEVLLFVASHGTAAADRFYVIPSDLGYTGKRTELDEKSVETILAHSISDQELEAAFEGMNAGRLLLVIDACNSGQALEAEEKRRGPMNSKGLAQLAYEKGMYVLTASQSFQAAQEVSQLGHGLLTYALVTEGLDKGDADDEPKDGKVAAREWLDFATGRVPKIQLEKMEEARKMGRSLKFGTGARGDSASDAEALQHPRVFYRRELDDALWIVGTPK